MEQLLILNGSVVNAAGISKADVLIADGKIAQVGNIENIPEGITVIDARGKYILPAGIDPHVHMQLPTPAGPSADDFLSGGVAALAGGTATLIDFVTPSRGQPLYEAFERRITEASACPADYTLHMGITWYGDEIAQQMEWCVKEAGIRTFKVYLAYKGSIGIEYRQLENVMQAAAKLGAIVLVHCEEGDLILQKQREFLLAGKTQPLYHALSRPPETESESVRKVTELCRRTGCHTYIVHTSTAASLQHIRQAKAEGLPVFCETCPQYLLLDQSVYEKPLTESLKYVISPPIRSVADQQALWEALADGTVDTVATDHCPFNTAGQKDFGLSDFTKIPNGAGGIEYRMALLYTCGVAAGRISLQRFVELTSAGAACIFGIFPRKGSITAGADADLVIFDPDAETIIRREDQYQNCDANIYEGFRMKGAPETVIKSGEIVFGEGAVKGFRAGSFLKIASPVRF